MGAAKIVGVLLSGLIGVSGISAGGAHLYTSETIENLIGEDALPQGAEFNEQWKAIQTKLNGNSGTPKTEELKKIKSTSNTTPADGNPIRDWCISVYRTTYKSILKPEDKALKEDAMTFCIYKIKEKLESTKLFKVEDSDESDKESIKKKLDTLKTHDNSKGNLDLTLTNLKDKITKNKEDDKDWKVLRSWCKSTYESGYKNDNKWKLAELYCKKDS